MVLHLSREPPFQGFDVLARPTMGSDAKRQLAWARYKAKWSDKATRLQVVDCEHMGHHRHAESKGRSLDHQIEVLEASLRFQNDPLVFRGGQPFRPRARPRFSE